MINKQLLSTLREEINAALAPVAAKHGLILHAANASFSEVNFTFKLEGRTTGDTGKPSLSSMEKRMIVMEIDHPAVTTDTVEGFTFVDRRTGRTQTIIGYNSKAPKFCIKLIDDRGQGSKAPGGYVRQNLPYQPVQTI